MNDMLAGLCSRCGLGEIKTAPTPVSGGLLHRMFRVETSRGVYAVKVLNPEVMARPTALRNMRMGEAAALAFAHRVPVCAAVDAAVHELDGAYFIIYPWVEGKSVFPPQITPEHCRIMGDVLGRIHTSGIRVAGMEKETTLRPPFDWPRGDDRLRQWDRHTLAALEKLQGRQVISHRDLDPKNVLWQGMTPCIIDWEAAGYVNPWQEMIEMLNYWAADEPMARAMLDAYGQHADLAAVPWTEAIQAGMDGMLGWLHYSMNRPGGEEQVRVTMKELEGYQARARLLLQWLKG